MERLMSVLLVVVAACGDAGGMSPMGFPDASGALDSASSSDGAPFQGLTLEWADMPVLPGTVSATVTVTSVKFHVKKLEVIGDAGDPMDTTLDEFDLAWSPMMPSGPPRYAFESAPPAIYSKVRINLDKGPSDAPSVEILGTTTANGSAEMFEITSTRKLDLEVNGYNINFNIGEQETVTVNVELDEGLENINWGNLPMPSNTRTLEDGNTNAMDAFLDDLEAVFTAPR
jgi:hypothetical protein